MPGKLKFTCNDNSFNKIDSEEKAYWLGYLYADGCLKQRRGGKMISLSSIDIDHLEKFKKFLNFKGRTTVYHNNTRYKNSKPIGSVTIHSVKLFDDLIKNGCFENKTFLLKFPTEEQVPKYLINHFIRGFFDGDGNVSTFFLKSKKHKSQKIGIHICGTYNFLDKMSDELETTLGGKFLYRDKRKTTDCWGIKTGSANKLERFFIYLYKNSIVYMERKFEKFEKFYKERRSTTIIEHPIGMMG